MRVGMPKRSKAVESGKLEKDASYAGRPREFCELSPGRVLRADDQLERETRLACGKNIRPQKTTGSVKGTAQSGATESCTERPAGAELGVAARPFRDTNYRTDPKLVCTWPTCQGRD
jgi:hypothetical protein